MKITLNEHTLCGGNLANETPSRFKINSQTNLQIIKAIRATFSQTCNRGNLQTKLVFEVGRKHRSQQEAAQHALLHASELKQASGVLQIDFEDKNNRRFQLESATLYRLQTHYKGNASYTLYEIYGGELHANH